MITYLNLLKDFFADLFTIEFVSGISIHTILFYNLILISFWVGLTRRS